MSSATINYGWVQPTIGGDPTTWGSELNTDLGLIDGVVFANQQAITAGSVPIGSITMFGGATAPANWLLCQGQSLSTTTYAALFAILGNKFGGSGGNFNLPNLQAKFPIGSGTGYALGVAGGAASVALTTAMLPAHSHPIIDPGHLHTSAAHNHGITDPGHSHGITDPGHAHTGVLRPTGSNTHGQPGSADSGVSSTDPSGTGITIASAVTGVGVAVATVGINAASTGITTTQSVGSGAVAPTIPPYLAINFIIRAT